MKSKNIFWSFAFGTLTGASLGLYLSTKEGKKFRKKAKRKIKIGTILVEEQLEVIPEQILVVKESTKKIIGDSIDTTQEYIGSVKNEATSFAENTMDAFERGINKAKARMQIEENKN